MQATLKMARKAFEEQHQTSLAEKPGGNKEEDEEEEQEVTPALPLV